MIKHVLMVCCISVLTQALPASAEDDASVKRDAKGPVEAELYEHMKDAMKNPTDNPQLPRVLLLGDSISIAYTVPVRQYLKDKANVHRPEANCQNTTYGLSWLKIWLGTGKWDVIHFNWGIHDTHYLDAKTGEIVKYAEEKSGVRQTRIRNTPEVYRQNLEKIVAMLRGTGAKLIWASSTPLLFREGERFDDIAKYNEVAAGVMRDNGIEINDLYAFTLPQAAIWQNPDKCHFNALGNKCLGDKVGKAILDALTN